MIILFAATFIFALLHRTLTAARVGIRASVVVLLFAVSLTGCPPKPTPPPTQPSPDYNDTSVSPNRSQSRVASRRM